MRIEHAQFNSILLHEQGIRTLVTGQLVSWGHQMIISLRTENLKHLRKLTKRRNSLIVALANGADGYFYVFELRNKYDCHLLMI